jgi:hypothetical protein
VVRSEADDLLFKHAGERGVKKFDATRVDEVQFVPDSMPLGASELPNPGRPVSATWSRKEGGIGLIKIDYLIDASGRFRLVSTKYLKNRRYNPGLKNIATGAIGEAVASMERAPSRRVRPSLKP